MFRPKETIKRKINISVLAVIILLSFHTLVFAQQQDFIKENNFGQFLNELMNIKLITDISKDMNLYGIPNTKTVFDELDIQLPVQKTYPEIPLAFEAINLTDYDLHKWSAAILGLDNPRPEKSDTREIIITSNSGKLLNTEELKLKNARLIDAILASQKNMASENPLMNLIWQINENMDFAIVGQYQLDMAYPDFVEYLKKDDEDQVKSALYAKLTLRF